MYLTTKITGDKLVLLSRLFIHSYIANKFPPLSSPTMCPEKELTAFSIGAKYLLLAICLLWHWGLFDCLGFFALICLGLFGCCLGFVIFLVG